jgi:hypothetical protein
MNNSGPLKRILLMLAMVLTVTFATQRESNVLLAGGENCPYPFNTCSNYSSECNNICASNGKSVYSFNCTEAPADDPNTCVSGLCVCDPSSCDCSTDISCCDTYCGGWNYDTGSCGYSPILLNLHSNSAVDHLTSPDAGVWFDLVADGVPRRVAWTEAGSYVAFLVLDRNGNGIIDNGSELFGNFTVLRNGINAANGFDALRDLDDNGDGRLDEKDLVYAKMMLWIDFNHNGVSEPNELASLREAGVTAIYTTYSESRRTDQYGNWYAYSGSALIAREHQQLRRRIFDVFLRAAP